MKHRTISLLIFSLLLLIWGRAPAQEQFARASSNDDDEPNWVWYTLLGNPTKYNSANNMAKTADGGYVIQGITEGVGNFIWWLDARGNLLSQKEYPFIEAFNRFALMENGYSVCGYWDEDNKKYIMLLDPQGDTVKTEQTYLNSSIDMMIPNALGGVNLNVNYRQGSTFICHFLEQYDENLCKQWQLRFNYIEQYVATGIGLLLVGRRTATTWLYHISYQGEILDSLTNIFPGYSNGWAQLFNAHNDRVGAINNAPDQPNGRLGFALLTARGEVLMYQDSSIWEQNGEGGGGVWRVQASPDWGYFAPMTVENNFIFPDQPTYLCVFKLTARGKYVADTGWDLMWYDHYFLTGAAVSDSGRLVICTNIDLDLNGKSDIFVGELRFNPELPTGVVTFPGVKPLNAYPNPVTGNTITFDLGEAPVEQITISNAKGVAVDWIRINESVDIYTHRHTLPAGFYVFTAVDRNGRRYNGKFVVQ